MDVDRNLLFGLLALQNGMIDQAKLVAAFQAWTLDKDRPLADHLVARGDLEPEQRAVIETLVGLHLKRHGGSAERSLAVIPVGRSARDSLSRLADPAIEASLAHLRSRSMKTTARLPEKPGNALTQDGSKTGSSVLARLGVARARQSPMMAPATENETDLDATGASGSDAGEYDHGTFSVGRYRLAGEIARGGMGAVLRGRDPDLGRDLALKVLLEQHRERRDLIDRFVEEAQICGQLQHPGVVPVYELGALDDNRPFFTMKLVKGRTLAALLAERKPAGATSIADGDAPASHGPPGPAYEELPRFLAIFEAVCQTMAYAHSRGVIHRDLKPSNVMVGSFGEVQVMDWGLAKVLARDGAPCAVPRQEERNETIVATARSLSDSELSESGSVLGTPAYMAPEQARGENENVGRRADVFALGSILCTILTGEPAFTGSSAIDILRKASRAELAEARARLDQSGAEPELIGLAAACLASEPTDRPADAGAVASRLTAYVAGVQERLRGAELARAAATARAEEARGTATAAEARAAAERRARRLTAALAATILLAGSLGAGGWRWIELERLARTRAAAVRVNAAAQEATRLRGQAQGAAVGDLSLWAAAVTAAEKARDLLDAGVEPGLRAQVEKLVAEVVSERGLAEAAAQAAERDRRLLDRLIDIRSAKADDRIGDGTDAAYAAALRDAGIDLDKLTPEQTGDRIKGRPPATASAIAVALDDWAAVRRDVRHDESGAKRVAAVARSADPDPWRNNLRDALEIAERPARRDRLTALAGSTEDRDLPAVSFDLLGKALGDVGAKVEAEAILRRGRRAHPGDVWLNYDLARALETLSHGGEAIRYYTAARMIRPETAHELAHALRMNGESEEGIGVFRDLTRIRPRNGRHLSCLGHALLVRGLRGDASLTLTEAAAALRETIAAHPDDFYAHLQLGNTLRFQNRLEEALAMYRKAVQLKPTNVDPLDGIGWILLGTGKYDEAAAIYRDSLRLDPDNTVALEGLGSALQELGQIDQAIELYRKALRIAPNDTSLHFKLGGALAAKGLFAEALAERQEAVRLTPDDSTVLHGLATGLREVGRFNEAEAVFRKSLENQPDNPHPLNSLAWLLVTAPDCRQRRPAEALELARFAVKEAPGVATNYNTLGAVEYRNGQWAQAIATLEKSIEMSKGTDPTDYFFLAMAQRQRGDVDEAERTYRRAVDVARNGASAYWEWRMIWAEAADLFGKSGPVPTLYEVNAEPDRAMSALYRMATRSGIRVEALRTDLDLAPLRGRPDFQLLLMDLAMPAGPFAE